MQGSKPLGPLIQYIYVSYSGQEPGNEAYIHLLLAIHLYTYAHTHAHTTHTYHTRTHRTHTHHTHTRIHTTHTHTHTHTDGGIDEMIDEMSGGKVLYAFLQVTDPNTQLPKNVFVNWVRGWDEGCCSYVYACGRYVYVCVCTWEVCVCVCVCV